mmetsp:Transcript_18698/g.33360  ORF Transcript_18698/g.33360 Transcript_18698/m.33360 type:complete len:352 (-) Transcript_18698:116-1171(-)
MTSTGVPLGGKRIVPGGSTAQQLLFLSALAVAVLAINLPWALPASEGGDLRPAPLGLVEEVIGQLGNSSVEGEAAPRDTAADLDYRSAKLQLLVEENVWKNSLILPASTRTLPVFVQTWLRNLVVAVVIYLGLGAVWAYYVYGVFGKELFGSAMPGFADMAEQIKVSMLALPLYSALPAVSEWMMEQGWTKAYPRVGEYGLPTFVAQFVIYIAGVELGVYWMHRSLHFGLLYRTLHTTHHKYNKEHTLSPFAGLAFNPLDGIMQAVPYVIMLFLVPFHALTHELLLFATAVWTTNIHDCVHGACEPIMGAGYHLLHHTNYKTNYGHYFVYMDWLFNSLEPPPSNKEVATST